MQWAAVQWGPFFTESGELLTPKPADRFVLWVLAERANAEGTCFPSVNHLCTSTSLSRRKVQKSLQFWRSVGLLEADQRFASTGRQTSHRYTLRLDLKTGGRPDWFRSSRAFVQPVDNL